MIIRPATGTGNKVIVQDQAGAAVLTTADAGATIASGVTNSGTHAGAISSNATFPAGHIIQVKSVVKTDTASYNSTMDVWVDIPGMSVTITPVAASSKFLVSYELNLGTQGAGSSSAQGMSVATSTARVIGGTTTALLLGTNPGSRIPVFNSERWIGEQNHELKNCGSQILDSPNTTSAITYKARWLKPYGSDPIYINRSHGDGDYYDRPRGASTITVMEVSG